MGFWGSVSLRVCVLVFGVIAVMQPTYAEDAENQAEVPQIADSTLKGVELAGVVMAAESSSTAQPSIRVSARDLRCLAEGIYFEARGESMEGQLAVGLVILNRVGSENYPDNICDVVYQNEDKRNRCQFSFACDGEPDVITEDVKWFEIRGYARWLLANDSKAGVVHQQVASLAASTHYHADYVHPYWAKHLTLTGRIGRHYFYYDPSA